MSNSKIKYHCLNDKKMRELGFSDNIKNKWYYCSGVSKSNNDKYEPIPVTFNIYINKRNNTGEIVILDENLLQPYDYEEILACNPKIVFAQKIRANVEKVMFSLQQAGVISGWEFGMKIL